MRLLYANNILTEHTTPADRVCYFWKTFHILASNVSFLLHNTNYHDVIKYVLHFVK